MSGVANPEQERALRYQACAAACCHTCGGMSGHTARVSIITSAVNDRFCMLHAVGGRCKGSHPLRILLRVMLVLQAIQLALQYQKKLA